MITDALLDLLEALIQFAFALFPTWTPDLGILPTVNLFLPVDMIAITFGVALAAIQSGLVVWGVMKVVNLIRGSGA